MTGCTPDNSSPEPTVASATTLQSLTPEEMKTMVNEGVNKNPATMTKEEAIALADTYLYLLRVRTKAQDFHDWSELVSMSQKIAEELVETNAVKVPSAGKDPNADAIKFVQARYLTIDYMHRGKYPF